MTALTQYLAWAEQQLAAVIVGEGLRVGCAGVTQGPMTITYRLRMLTPNRADLGRLLALGPTLAQAVQAAAVRVTDTAGGVLVELPSPQPRTPSAADLAGHTQGPGRVAVGYDAFRKPVHLDFAAHPHLLAVGPTRRGKTEAIKSLLYGMAITTPARRLVYVILAKKRQTWAAFAPAAGCYGVVSDDADVSACLAWLAGDVLQRRTRAGLRLPQVFIVCDDLANLSARADIGGALAELASMGGEAGLHLLLSTQTTGRAGGLTSALEGNLTARLVFGAADAAAAARFAGGAGSGADAVGTAPGDALLVVDGTPQRIATAQSDDRLISLLPVGVTPRPWEKRAEPPGTGRTAPNRARPTPTGEGTPPLGGGARREPVTEPGAAFDLAQPITAAERAHAATLRAGGASLNQTCIALYGFKNGRTWGRLHDVLQAPAKPTEEGAPPAAELDLTTDEGRAALAELQRAGLVHLPNKELVQ